MSENTDLEAIKDNNSFLFTDEENNYLCGLADALKEVRVDDNMLKDWLSDFGDEN